jgi:hypothetical protein
VNTAADLVVVASRCTGRLVGKRRKNAKEPTVHLGYCQVLNIRSRGATLDTVEAEGEISVSVAYYPDQCLGCSKQEG